VHADRRYRPSKVLPNKAFRALIQMAYALLKLDEPPQRRGGT
jgi:hypothetical protein